MRPAGLARRPWASTRQIAEATGRDVEATIAQLEQAHAAGLVDRRVSRSGISRWRYSARFVQAVAAREAVRA